MPGHPSDALMPAKIELPMASAYCMLVISVRQLSEASEAVEASAMGTFAFCRVLQLHLRRTACASTGLLVAQRFLSTSEMQCACARSDISPS